MKQHKAFFRMYVSRCEVFPSFGSEITREFLGLVRQGKHGEAEFLDFPFLKNCYIKIFFHSLIFYETKFYIYEQPLMNETI